MEKWIYALYSSLERNFKKTIVGFLAITIFLGSQATKLEKNIVIKDQIDKSSIDYAHLTFLEKNFEKYYRVPIMITGDITDSKNICKILHWLEQRAINDPNLITINSPFHIREVNSTKDKLLYPTIISLNCDKQYTIDYTDLDSTPWSDIFTSTKSKNNLLFELLLQKEDITLNKRKFNSNVIRELDKDFEYFLKSEGLDYSFYLLSWASNRRYVHDGIKKTTLLNGLLFVIILILFRYLFGSYRSGALLVISLVFMGIYLYGMMSLAGIPIDMLNSGIFLLLSISALQDYIFIKSKMLKENISFNQAAKELLIPSFFTSMTTVIGFGSLYLSDIVILQRFGLCAAFGAIVEWTLTFLLLPALTNQFTFFKNTINKSKSHEIKILNKLIRTRLPKIASVILLGAYITGSATILKPNIKEEPFGIYPEDHKFSKGIKNLINTRSWSASFDILFKTTDHNKIQRVLNEIRKIPEVTKVLSFHDIQNYFTKGLSKERKDLIKRELKQTQVYKRFKNDDITRSIVYIKRNEVSFASKLKGKIRGLCEEDSICFATGNIMAYTEFGDKVPRALIKSFATTLLLVTLTLIFILWINNKGDYLLTIASSMWGPFASLTMMWLMNIPINYITCMFASIIVGLTGDNAIQYIYSSKKQPIDEGANNMGQASILIFIVTASCSSIFLFGYFKFSKDFGVILILGGLLSLLGDIWILKSFKRS